MVKARMPGSSQELYTVSVESVPQYTTSNSKKPGCCRGGRVGKDLLCGVLIALAVICAAVAIFLVVFYVVNGESSEPTTGQNGTLGSSPLTRDREEETKINSLSNPFEQVTPKDHLSLSSTPLPDVGIHEPDFHISGVGHEAFPPYKSNQAITESTTVQPTTESTPDPTTSTTLSPVEDILPLVEVKSEDVSNETTLFVPDDDVVIETPSVETNTTNTNSTIVETNSTNVELPPPEIETSGFVPVKIATEDEQEAEEQTESSPEVIKPVTEIAIDTAPWKPIDIPLEPEVRLVDDSGAKEDQSLVSEEPKVITTVAPTHSTTTEVIAEATTETTTKKTEISSEFPSLEPEAEESTDFALMQDLGNMALLVPEDRVRTSTGSPSSSELPVPLSVAEPMCIRRQLPFCRGVLPYSETILPNWVGDKNEAERNLSVPYFEIIAESECHPRVQQYACAVLEPPCRGNGISLPPCRQFCRAIAEDCTNYVLSALPLASVLNCDQFPDSNDPNICLNLASTTPEGECLPGEYRCNVDNTCIPDRWICDGRKDCSQSDDESTCTKCRDEEFKCESENRCLPKRWRCDGSRDCADGSDERDCPANQECGDGQFRCADGLSCIPLRRVCDGSNHCRDNSDETNCTAIVCQNEDFKCHDNNICIPRQWTCDNNWDCKDGSDELDCVELETEELPVNGTNTSFNPEKCPLGELLCMSDSSCIRFEQLCDGARDCSDGADETDCSSDEE